jgi:hypothetical protein
VLCATSIGKNILRTPRRFYTIPLRAAPQRPTFYFHKTPADGLVGCEWTIQGCFPDGGVGVDPVAQVQKQGLPPKRIITNRLRSYGVARRPIMPHIEHYSHKGLNYRAENSPVPLRRWERMMQRFRSPSGLQRFVSAQS